MLFCCGIQYGTYRFAGFTGLFLLLPGIFACGIVFDRGSGFFATVLGAALSLFLIFPRTSITKPWFSSDTLSAKSKVGDDLASHEAAPWRLIIHKTMN
jgi:hypothetical protein